MSDLVLDAATFAPPSAPDTAPFGIDSGSEAAIKALRALADAMETGTVIVKQSQTGVTAAEGEFIEYRVFLEYTLKPW
jgi:hypothetical protein